MAKSKEGTSTSSFGTSGRINHDASKFYNSRLYTEYEAAAQAMKAFTDAAPDKQADAE